MCEMLIVSWPCDVHGLTFLTEALSTIDMKYNNSQRVAEHKLSVKWLMTEVSVDIAYIVDLIFVWCN